MFKELKIRDYIFIFIILFGGLGNLWDFSSILVGENNAKILKGTLKQIIQESVEEEFKKNIDKIYNSDYNYSLELVRFSFKECRTEQDVIEKISFYEENEWGAQISAMKTIVNNDYAINKLPSVLYKPDFARIIIVKYK